MLSKKKKKAGPILIEEEDNTWKAQRGSALESHSDDP